MSEELIEMKTDIALIKADIKKIEGFFAKVEDSIGMMQDLATTQAVQAEIIKNAVDKLEDLDTIVEEHRKDENARTKAVHQRLEEYRRSAREDHQRLSDENAKNRIERHNEILSEVRKMNESLNKKLTKQDERIQSLEKWKYYMMGMGAVVVFLLAKVADFSNFFG